MRSCFLGQLKLRTESKNQKVYRDNASIEAALQRMEFYRLKGPTRGWQLLPNGVFNLSGAENDRLKSSVELLGDSGYHPNNN